ncbi:MAG: two component transcriptional regulator, LuxR family [Solirubrobacterales bacterium]|nr:two component transcriptional regulator, LuxR family [Solirubrobacterales bacterium]
MPIRVALAEDSFLMREALTQLMREEEDLEVVAACRDCDELRDALDGHEVDVVVTDICMPPTRGDEGIRIAAELRTTRPTVGVVVLSAHCDAAFALRLLESGCERRGYLLKERVHSGRQLTASIKAVAGGGSVIDPKVVQTLVEARDRHADSPLETLSPRERDILVEMARGSSNAAIGAVLGMNKRGVEKHINSIFVKLALPAAPDVCRRVRAVLMFLAETDAPVAGP